MHVLHLHFAQARHVLHSTSRSYWYASLHEGEVCTLVLFHFFFVFVLFVCMFTVYTYTRATIRKSCGSAAGTPHLRSTWTFARVPHIRVPVYTQDLQESHTLLICNAATLEKWTVHTGKQKGVWRYSLV